jgi:hypothetical protein
MCQLLTILDFRLALSFGVLLNMSQRINICLKVFLKFFEYCLTEILKKFLTQCEKICETAGGHKIRKIIYAHFKSPGAQPSHSHSSSSLSGPPQIKFFVKLLPISKSELKTILVNLNFVPPFLVN